MSLAVIVAIAVGWVYWRQHDMEQAALPVHAAGSAGSAVGVGSAGSAGSDGSDARAGSGPAKRHVRRVSAADRQKLAAQIQAAQAARTAASARAGSSATATALDDHRHDLDREPTAELDALQESVPFLADCYEKQGSGRPAGGVASAALTLTNDPDIGAVIDPGEITDGSGAPLPKELDACLRNTILTLQLPPLAAGDTAKVVYSFRFDGAR